MNEIAGAVPVPERPTACGLPAALSAIASDPERVPVAVGAKTMETVQFFPAGSVEPHVVALCEKSPDVLSEEIVIVALPVFVNVTV